jgi:long-chain acyl-CoA synthetase
MRGKPQVPPQQLVRDPDVEPEVRRAVAAATTLASQAEAIRTFCILPSPSQKNTVCRPRPKS